MALERFVFLLRAMATAGQKIVFQLDGNAQIHKSFIIMASVFMFSKALEKLLVRMMYCGTKRLDSELLLCIRMRQVMGSQMCSSFKCS